MFKLGQFMRSFKYALKGLVLIFREEQSFRIQLIASVAVFLVAGFLRVKTWELIILVLVCSSVMVLELLNSILERMVDALKPRIHPYVRVIKDMMAATVLLASVAALVVGILIFGAHINL